MKPIHVAFWVLTALAVAVVSGCATLAGSLYQDARLGILDRLEARLWPDGEMVGVHSDYVITDPEFLEGLRQRLDQLPLRPLTTEPGLSGKRGWYVLLIDREGKYLSFSFSGPHLSVRTGPMADGNYHLNPGDGRIGALLAYVETIPAVAESAERARAHHE
jgi:hypothetical protein